LTGITQDKVDSGLPLREALDRVHVFLENLGVFKSEFVFLSCGDFDGNQIRREALHKQMNIPNYLKRWINLKKVFPTHLFDKSAPRNDVKFVKDVRKPPVGGMPHMLELCGLKLEGRHHSGIDDSRNIAACVIRCL
jgi:ERI1 exoribonuclease 3